MIKLVEEFYELNKDKFPDLSKEHFIRISKHLFTNVKETFKEGNLEEVRIKNLGTFKVFPGSVRRIRKDMNVFLEKNVIPEKEYIRIIKMIDKYENDL
jgi:nucleoid DNA-binding protein